MKEPKITLPYYPSPSPYGGSVWQWFLFFLSPYKLQVILWSLFSVLRKSVFRAHPFFLGVAISMVEDGSAQDDSTQLIHWLIFYFALLLIMLVLIRAYIPVGRLIDKISKQMSLYGLRHYMRLPESWHEEHASGEKLQRLTLARQHFREVLDMSFWHVVVVPGLVLVLVLSLLTLNAPLHYLALYGGYMVTYCIAGYVTGHWLNGVFKRLNETLEQLIGGVYEFVVSTATIRYFNLKQHIFTKGCELETVNHDAQMDIYRMVCKRWHVNDGVAWFWIAAITAIASYEAVQGHLSLGAYSAILFFNITLWYELENIAILYKDLIERWEGFRRFVHILNVKPSIEDAKDAQDLPRGFSPALSYKGVCFRYNDKKHVINDLNLDIKAGEKIGVLGPSGAGKSTIIKLLMRFYDPQQGSVHIAGHDLRTITQYSLQDSVAIIPQDVTLFNHPLIENIRYGRLDASDEEVIEAAKKSHAHEFIEQLPEGYQTLVGERGVKLSGGQRQRIAIARAILKDAPILILDEATSALDSESEALIQQSLESLMEGKTVIAIAHRLSTIAHLDRLIVMDQGRIVEDGTHDALKDKKGSLYAKLWSMQSGGFVGA